MIITGATKGIGWAIAKRFAPHCQHLALIARSENGLEEAKAALLPLASDTSISLHACDLSEKSAVKGLLQDLKQRQAEYQILVNNAGLYLPGQLLEEPDEAMESMLQLNVLAPYYLSKGIVPLLRGKSHIFNLSSVASRQVYTGKASYSVTKFALQALNDALRMELSERGIRVTAVLPGPTWSATWEGADLPEDRLLQAGDVAEAVWNAYALPANAVVEELMIRPQLGDL